MDMAYWQPIRPHLSFALPSATVCHCMLDGESAPPHASAFTWSTTYPGQAPVDLPVAGHGCSRMNSRRAAAERAMRPVEASRSHVVHRWVVAGR